MIYFISPKMRDFHDFCHNNDIPVTNGVVANQFCVRWISNWRQLMGTNIRSCDEVIWGNDASYFKPEEYNRIYEELALRRRG